MSKKAQLQMMENSFVLITIFIILILAFIFVMAIQEQDRKEKIEQLRGLEIVKKSQVLNFIPELQCSDSNDIDPDCYDILKMIAFKDRLEQEKTQDDRYYHNALGNLNITVKRFDPSPDENKWIEEWNIYDNPPSENNGIMYVHYPVLLRDPIKNSNYFGVLKLGVYR